MPCCWLPAFDPQDPLVCSDLFRHIGHVEAMTSSDLIGPSR
jgi:hypothetical protein